MNVIIAHAQPATQSGVSADDCARTPDPSTTPPDPPSCTAHVLSALSAVRKHTRLAAGHDMPNPSAVTAPHLFCHTSNAATA